MSGVVQLSAARGGPGNTTGIQLLYNYLEYFLCVVEPAMSSYSYEQSTTYGRPFDHSQK